MHGMWCFEQGIVHHPGARLDRHVDHLRSTGTRGLQFEIVFDRPPRSLRSRLPLTRGRLRCKMRALFSPSVRGRAAEGGRGSLTRHLELEFGPPCNDLWLLS
jgi:hypothetical protein